MPPEAAATPPPRLIGVDFTSAPSAKKPITVAHGERSGAVVRLQRVDELRDFAAFEALLREPGPWHGAFDFPFGLPRAFVDDLGLGSDGAAVWRAVKARCPTRMDFRALVDTWGNGRPAGQRLLHRRTDGAMPGTSSSSPLQTRYVPVGFMWFEGYGRLLDAGVHLPRQREGDRQRTAQEAYPGWLAFELIGRRSYKNSPEPDRLIARKDLVDALEQGRSRLGLRLRLGHALREALIDDASGDRLDAVLCLLQAAWASQREEGGLPADTDPVEGWITSAGAA